MLEKLFSGPKSYYVWLLFLLCVIAGCGLVYLDQLQSGLGITGMNREVSWGLYISQFTYFVGVAASAVMLVLPAYFHHYKKFKRMIIFGEFMAVAAVVMCALFIVVDLGQPQRMLNVMLHPTPNSVMFYDMIVLIGYLCLTLTASILLQNNDRIRLSISSISLLISSSSIPQSFLLLRLPRIFPGISIPLCILPAPAAYLSGQLPSSLPPRAQLVPRHTDRDVR